MPTLARLPDCSIHMYAGDHLPPHVHIRMRDGREVLVSYPACVSCAARFRRMRCKTRWHGYLDITPNF